LPEVEPSWCSGNEPAALPSRQEMTSILLPILIPVALAALVVVAVAFCWRAWRTRPGIAAVVAAILVAVAPALLRSKWAAIAVILAGGAMLALSARRPGGKA
jgi:hypothetical protein